VLLGTEFALGRHLGQAEVIWEYRSSESQTGYDRRARYRRGFFLYYRGLMANINTFNDLQHYQDGLFVWDIPTFNEQVVREALLNAVTHRDYRSQASVFVRHFPRKMEVTSPGGFPPGVTAENILDQCVPRNRRIAQAFERCGLVEQGGQGADLMFKACIKESKPKPNYSRTDDFQVWLTLHGEVQNPQFLRFLERIGQERLQSFSTEDFLLLDAVHQGEQIPEKLRPRLGRLLEQGIIEREGRGRGTRYLLSCRFYTFVGQPGTYTRRRGLDRGTNKQLLLRHIRDNEKRGCRLQELRQVLPHLSSGQVQGLLRELREEGLVHSVGRTRAGRWYLRAG
jgi:ATP-dependent DNA helicase RecG